MAFNPTPAQKSAIETKGNVLVSAAAGSGKTAVLVERVISLMTDKENPISADKMLIVTFTNAAAAEMRGRIEKRLDEECRIRSNDRGLIRQKYLLANAKICTIDSFCIDLVRENFEKAGVSPDFKISDKGTLRAIDERVIGEIVNEYISDGNEDFLRLLDMVGAEYDEANFIEKVLEIYDYSRQLAEPLDWFNSFEESFREDNENILYKFSFNAANKSIKSMRNSLAVLIDAVSSSEKAAEKFMPTLIFISEELARLNSITERENWDEFYNALNELSLPPKPSVIGSIPVTKAAKMFLENTEKEIEALKKFFSQNSEEMKTQNSEILGSVRLFSEILKEFDSRVWGEYLKANTLTFHNTEHLALKLLTTKNEEGENEFLNRYDVVMVDEYQDTNDLQDRLFFVLSNSEQKLFAVGDVKQSIYGFRGANPNNFLQKKKRYIPLDEASDNQPKKIILSNNFRSNKEICSFANFFFERFMTEENSSLYYGDEEKLISSSKFEPCADAVRLEIIERGKTETSALMLEGFAILKYIKEIMTSGKCLNGKDGELREAQYRDFAILLRATKNKASVIATLLRSAGIPVNFSVEGFAERMEISTVLSLLKIIDNPRMDIELACVMLSPIFAFSPDELAEIKAGCTQGDFYTAVRFAADNGNAKVGQFLAKLEYYRSLSLINNLSKLISLIINESGYINMVNAMSEGANRKNNLLLLVSYAGDYENNVSNSISGFVDYIRAQSERGLKSAGSLSGNDSVKIMSIHSSKGLQFPICIIANTSADFKSDYNKNSVAYNSDFHIGFRYFDEASSKKKTTLGYEVIGENERAQVRMEELRLLYVAMTRAQEKLVFITTIKNFENKKKSICEKLLLSGNKITSELFRQTSSYSDWLLLAAALHPSGKEIRDNPYGIIADESDSCLNVNLLSGEELSYDISPENIEEIMPDEDTVNEILRNISFEYPYEQLRNIEAKASVSAVANKAEGERFAFSEAPSFMNSGGVTPTERGTAMHKIMQFIDFSKAMDIDAEIDRLCEWQFISETEAQALNRNALKSFFESELFARIKASSEVHREMRFLTEADASLISEDIGNTDEKIILQGAVDLCFVEDDGIVILDFKTDRVENEEQLINAYGEQLEFYAIACEKIFSRKVKEKIIYSFALRKVIVL